LSENCIRLPLIPLRGLVAFPTTATTFDAGREKSINAIERAMLKERKIMLVTQRSASVENPGMADLYQVGSIVRIKQLMRMPDGVVRVFAEGVSRIILTGVLEGGDHQVGEAFEVPVVNENLTDEESAAYMRLIKTRAAKLARSRAMGGPNNELVNVIRGESDPVALSEIVAANLINEVVDKQTVLECADMKLRLETVLNLITRDIDIARLEGKIAARVRETMDKANHDYYLREQIHAIQEELGEDDDEDIAELRKRLSVSPISGEAREKVERELKRLTRMTMHSPESSVSYNYIDYLLSIPWNKYTEAGVDIRRARQVLDEDHFGMRDVKDRLLEYLGVRALNPEMRSPIICLVGPPGVGKTSIARSIARALGREFAQMSLGGVHDESELRGHRRTYIGAMAGRVVSAITQSGSMDPVFLFDEIDKLSRSMNGDPASAMLEILDPEQNSRFRDHYVDAPVDLSRVMFITTANTTDTIDRALLDRMEVIELSSYTMEEKVQISKRHLVPKELKAHGMKPSQLRIHENALRELIDKYTRESGVRTLERLIGKICRKAALAISEEEDRKSVTVNVKTLKSFLGAPRFLRTPVSHTTAVGVVNGLAWTSVGGEVMPIEALVLDGSGKVELTGQLGGVMKESAGIGYSIVRSKASALGISSEFFKNHDLHVHVPEGAVPKDGPSAGVALTCALLSAVSGVPANGDIAMTGEITLTGRVLPIGGVKEKLLAAYRMGVNKILLPRDNGKDLEEIDEAIRSEMEITLVDNIDDAIKLVLSEPIEKAAKPERMRAV